MKNQHETHKAALFAVASELSKRGYKAALSSEERQLEADIIAISPKTEVEILIDVKGIYRKNSWPTRRLEDKENYFCILALVPLDEPNQFYILAARDVNTAIDTDLERLGRPHHYKWTGVDWRLAQAFRDRWDKLPK